MRTINNDYAYRNEHYTIVYDGKFYMTVNHCLIGSDGHPVRELSFMDGLHLGRTLGETIQQTREDLDMQYYIAQGMSREEAYAKTSGLPLEFVKEIFKI